MKEKLVSGFRRVTGIKRGSSSSKLTGEASSSRRTSTTLSKSGPGRASKTSLNGDLNGRKLSGNTSSGALNGGKGNGVGVAGTGRNGGGKGTNDNGDTTTMNLEGEEEELSPEGGRSSSRTSDSRPVARRRSVLVKKRKPGSSSQRPRVFSALDEPGAIQLPALSTTTNNNNNNTNGSRNSRSVLVARRITPGGSIITFDGTTKATRPMVNTPNGKPGTPLTPSVPLHRDFELGMGDGEGEEEGGDELSWTNEPEPMSVLLDSEPDVPLTLLRGFHAPGAPVSPASSFLSPRSDVTSARSSSSSTVEALVQGSANDRGQRPAPRTGPMSVAEAFKSANDGAEATIAIEETRHERALARWESMQAEWANTSARLASKLGVSRSGLVMERSAVEAQVHKEELEKEEVLAAAVPKSMAAQAVELFRAHARMGGLEAQRKGPKKMTELERVGVPGRYYMSPQKQRAAARPDAVKTAAKAKKRLTKAATSATKRGDGEVAEALRIMANRTPEFDGLIVMGDTAPLSPPGDAPRGVDDWNRVELLPGVVSVRDGRDLETIEEQVHEVEFDGTGELISIEEVGGVSMHERPQDRHGPGDGETDDVGEDDDDELERVPGPALKVAADRLVFETAAGVVSRAVLAAVNVGSTALRYHWKRVEQAENTVSVVPVKPSAGACMFLLHDVSGVILPGDTHAWSWQFSAVKPGVFSEQWALETSPQVGVEGQGPAAILTLKGISLDVPDKVNSRKLVEDRLAAASRQRTAAAVVHDLVSEAEMMAAERLQEAVAARANVTPLNLTMKQWDAATGGVRRGRTWQPDVWDAGNELASRLGVEWNGDFGALSRAAFKLGDEEEMERIVAVVNTLAARSTEPWKAVQAAPPRVNPELVVLAQGVVLALVEGIVDVSAAEREKEGLPAVLPLARTGGWTSNSKTDYPLVQTSRGTWTRGTKEGEGTASGGAGSGKRSGKERGGGRNKGKAVTPRDSVVEPGEDNDDPAEVAAQKAAAWPSSKMGPLSLARSRMMSVVAERLGDLIDGFVVRVQGVEAEDALVNGAVRSVLAEGAAAAEADAEAERREIMEAAAAKLAAENAANGGAGAALDESVLNEATGGRRRRRRR